MKKRLGNTKHYGHCAAPALTIAGDPDEQPSISLPPVICTVIATVVPMCLGASPDAPSVGDAAVGRPLGDENRELEGGRPGYAKARELMVQRDLRARGIQNESVLAAMTRIERQRFVPVNRQEEAYIDEALQIGHEQTISRPYIVALMTELVRPTSSDRVLDVGTGSGYQAAVLGEICHEVCSIEIVAPLANEARTRLKTLGHKNIQVRCGDGYQGWPDKAPFDVIVVAAAPDHVPEALVNQLAPNGRLVIPVGSASQELLLIEKDAHGVVQRPKGVAGTVCSHDR